MNDRAYIALKSGKDQSVRKFHPWVFSGGIKKSGGSLVEGELVDVYDNKDEFLGSGHYSSESIAVRILSFDRNEEINADFYTTKLKQAYSLRKKAGLIANKETNIYRFINSEGDGLSGLIIDMYGTTAVIQCLSCGMLRQRSLIIEIMKGMMGTSLAAVYDKSPETAALRALNVPINCCIFGKLSSEVFLENNLKFTIDWVHGQKTGFFIDQRENRKLLGSYATGKTVLDLFSYTGAFSAYAMQSGAKMVHSVDSSARALQLCDKNIEINFSSDNRHQSFTDDAFKYLDENGEQYDLIVLDPDRKSVV